MDNACMESITNNCLLCLGTKQPYGGIKRIKASLIRLSALALSINLASSKFCILVSRNQKFDVCVSWTISLSPWSIILFFLYIQCQNFDQKLELKRNQEATNWYFSSLLFFFLGEFVQNRTLKIVEEDTAVVECCYLLLMCH